MAEQMVFSSESELEQALRELGTRVAFPETPQVALRVRQQLASMPTPAPDRPRFGGIALTWRRALALLLVAALVVVGAALAISPDARQAVADRLGVRGVSIEHIPEAPTPAAVSSPSPSQSAGSPPGAALGLGSASTLENARAAVGFAVLLPSALGQPDAVYVRNADQVSFVYAPREGLPRAQGTASVGLLLTEFRARLDATLFGKGVPPGARLEEVQVRGTRGYFISGAPHTFFYRDASNNIQDERSRLAGNTLLWEANGITYRLESALDRDAAIRLAESLQ